MPGWLQSLQAAGRWKGVLVAAVLAGFCGACQDDLSRYYPLEDGRTWQYRVSLVQPGKEAVVTAGTVVNLPAQTVLGRNAAPQRSELFGQTVVRFLADDGSGVLEFAQQVADEPPQAKERPSYVLKQPVEVGTSWSSTWRGARRGMPVSFPVVKAITSVDDTVMVPAGTFADCLHVRISGRVELDLGTGLANVEVTGDEWYAPGVGFIKAAFRETVNAGESITELSIDLESYERPR